MNQQTKETLKIKRVGNGNFDFEAIPQGYIHRCVVGVPKIKYMKKSLCTGNRITDPTDAQVIDYARKMMVNNDMYGQNSGKNPDSYEIVIVDAEA